MPPSTQVGFRRGIRGVLYGFVAPALLASLAPLSADGASFAFARSGAASSDGDGTSLTLQLTGVGAGDLIVVYVKYEGSATTATVSDGASTFAADTAVHAANGDLHGQFFYALAAQASGTVTYTATWAASKPYRKLFVYEYSHTGTVATFDVSGRATATTGTLNSGAVTTTGTDEVAFGSYGEYDASTTSNEQIGGAAADQVRRQAYAAVWSKAFASPFTGAATATGNSSTWISNIIAFKTTGPAETVPPSVGITAPAAGSTVSGTVQVGATAADNVAVAGVQFKLDGASLGAEDTVAPYSVNWDTTTASNAGHTLTAVARDTSNNTATSAAIAVTVANAVPFDFALSNGGNRSVARSASVSNTINASLLAGVTAPVSFTISGLPSGTSASFNPASCSPPCGTTLTLTTGAATPLATSTLTVTGTAGTLTRTTTFTLTVSSAPDNTPPTVSLSAPAAGAAVAGSITVSATASDNVGVVGVQFLLDGANLSAEDTTSPYSILWNTTSAAGGTHVLAARARDAAGNSSGAPGVTVTVDNQAPTGSVTINAGAAATNSLTASLTLSATDALTGVSQMRFSNNGSSYSTAEAYATTRTWTLSNSGGGTKTVSVQFRDTAGNWSGAFADTIVYDTTAPTVSAVASSNVTSASATITWTTNEAATSQVEYGPTTAYGSLTLVAPALLVSHNVGLGGLAPSTTYNYRVRSKDAAGNERIGTNNTFRTTAGSDTSAPSVPTGLVATAVSGTQVNLSWNASTDNVAVTGYDVFRDGQPAGSSTSTSFQNGGLVPGTSYSFAVAARDAAGNVSGLSLPATATTPAFTVTNVQATSVTATSAVIGWATSVPATSQVEYGPTTAYGTLTTLDSALVTSHSQVLSGLVASTTYHYRVRSRDAGNHLVVSGDFVLTTSSGGSSGAFQNELLVSNLSLPTAIKFLPDGSMVVLELGGRILKVDTNTWQVSGTFLQLTNIGTLNGQQGLMDMVLDPNFATNHYYYLFYTLGSPNRDRVARFTATADLAGTVAGSEFLVYQDPQTANDEHHGGALAFGNDGKLYLTTGEHFSPDNSQSLTSPRGKLLRFNKDGTVPTDNPFYDGAGPNFDAIWALGLRNPFRASYDSLTGRLYIGDVGGNDYSTAREAVNVGMAGANYGWPLCEGSSCPGGAPPNHKDPLYSYGHSYPPGRDAAIVGGFVYRGSQFPAQYYGNYFFADYTQNWIRRLTLDANGAVTGVANFEPPDGSTDGPYGDIVYLCEGPDGALYYVDLGYSDTTGQTDVGKIRRVRFISNNQPPVVLASAQPTEGGAPLTVAFSTAGTSDPEGDPLTYAWTFGDGGTSTAGNPVHTYVANGAYSARVTVSDGGNGTLSTPIVIQVGNKPVATILTPLTGVLFRAGDVVSFSGEGTDAEDGVLPASAFTWSVDFLHEGHVHPGLPQTGVKSGALVIPTSGHDFHGNTRYRITLTVTDSDGLRASAEVLVYPDKVNLSFGTVPSGLSLTLDGIPYATPFVYDTLIGFSHQVAATNQTSGQNAYGFLSWSDGGAQQHTIVVPNAAAFYTATYSVTQNPVPPGLVAGYGFAEGTGIVTADISGNGNGGTLVNGPTWTVGQYGGGLAFGGTSYVNLGNGPAFQLTGSITLSAWIRISANPGDDGAIVAKLRGAGWQLKTSPDTGVRTAAIQISSNGSDSIQRYSATVLAVGTWYHVAGVYDSAARTLSIYVNGLLDNGVLSGTVPAAQANSTENVNIAQRTGYPGQFNFLGTIDEVHVFNRALSAAEIQLDMNTPRTGP
jgi:glucose/arabinose dehydrogenase/PKD repeat protein